MAETDDLERPSTDYSMDMREFGSMATGRGTTRMASMSTLEEGEGQSDVRHHGSFSRLSSMFVTNKGTMSTIKGKSPVRSIYEASMVTDSLHRHSHEHIHDLDEDGLENVRACCGGISSLNNELTLGKHDVGTLHKKGKVTHK